MATGHDEGQPKPKVTDLNRTQRDVLWALLAGESNGLEITSRLEDYYGESVNTGRVYPACDALADCGLIAKDESANGRQNTYKLTADGHAALQRRQSWQNEMRTSGYDGGSE